MSMFVSLVGVLALSSVAPQVAADGLRGSYDPQNPFAQIMRDELPATRVYEDRKVLVIVPLSVASPGHVLVIPKAQARNLLDLPPKDFDHIGTIIQKAAIAQQRAYGATGFKLVQNNGASAGQTVFHVHFHVVPTYDGVALDLNADRKDLDKQEAEAMAAKLRAAWPR